MKISTRGRYGLHLMYYLAKNNNKKPVPLSIIANDVKLPENYLEQLVRNLRDANLVISVRGAHGGYMLAKDPEEISIGQILRELETHMNATDCAAKDHVCSEENHCPARSVWRRIQGSINDAVDNYTLKDMMDNDSNLEEEING